MVATAGAALPRQLRVDVRVGRVVQRPAGYELAAADVTSVSQEGCARGRRQQEGEASSTNPRQGPGTLPCRTVKQISDHCFPRV